MKAFTAMLGACYHHKLPRAFHGDIFNHDKARLAGDDAPGQFGWVLRECGSLLLDSRMQITSRYSYKEHVTKSDKRAADRFYYWDGQSLELCSAEIMFQRMAQSGLAEPPTGKPYQHNAY